MSFIPTIFVVGELSSGKSSFLNALASGFVSSVSLQRETFTPIYYKFRKNVSETNLDNITISMEQIHEQNQSQREQLNSNIKTTNRPIAYTLPIRYGLPDMDVIDFPGLNDSDDKNNEFMKVMEKNIHDAHIILFVTDATKAFTNASELDTYNKIKQCVDAEYKKNYHHIELITIINKYDETDDEDIEQIYYRISNKIGTDMKSLFRVSSHKLFINSIVDRKGSAIIPKFLKSESIKILKNSNVVIGEIPKQFQSIYNLWKLDHNELKFHYDLNIKFINCKLVGDWDNLIEYIREFNGSYHSKYSDKLGETLSDTCDKIVGFYDLIWGSPYDRTDTHIPILTSYVIKIQQIMEKLKLININMNEMYAKIIVMFNAILDYSMVCNYKAQTYRFLIIEILFGMINNEIFRTNIINIITNDKIINRIDNVTILALINFDCIHQLWEIPNGRKKIISLLSLLSTYSNEIEFSLKNPSYYYENHSIIKKCFFDTKLYVEANWFIAKMINSTMVPQELKYTILISITDVIVLKQLHNDNDINYAYLDKCEDGLSVKLKLCLCYVSQENMTTHRKLDNSLFTMGKYPEIQEICDKYKKTKHLLKTLF